MNRSREWRGRGCTLLLPLLALVFTGCSQIAYDAIDQTDPLDVDVEVASDIVTPPGFRAVKVVEGLNYPSAITFDDAGQLFVLESHTVPVPGLEPRIYRVKGREVEPVAMEGEQAPSGTQAVGLTFHGGWLYVSHEERDGSWGISRVRPQGGNAEAVLRGLPPLGDHWINYLAFDRRGDLYFGIGSATNSGVVSSHDPVNLKWLEKYPQARDYACRDLVLRPSSFADENAVTKEEGDRAATAAYHPYGSTGTRVAASPWCTGSIYRLPAGGGKAELVAWGFRNPVALAFAPDGDLLVGMHGADIRGTRPVNDDPDAVYRVRQGAWYGWPDYAADLRPLTDARYQPPAEYLAGGQTSLGFVIDHAASGLRAPDRRWMVAATAPHAALGGMAVVPRGGPFRKWQGKLLLPEMGDFRPTTDPVKPNLRAGFQVEVIDLRSGRREVFARNRGDGPPQPSSALDLEHGFERPVDVKVGPDGLVYVLDYGVWQPTPTAARVMPKTGKVFRIEPAPRSRAGG
jgi:glucose/arabinose dehydrogenase